MRAGFAFGACVRDCGMYMRAEHKSCLRACVRASGSILNICII